MSRLLAAVEGQRYHPMPVLIALTVLRWGEALALRWTDVDLDAGLLRVAGSLNRVNGSLSIAEPKTAKSRRTTPLSGDLVAMLRKHRTTQKRERLAAVNQWQHCDLVFTMEFGSPVEPRNVLWVVQSGAAKAGLAQMDAHTLRHSVATALMEGGVPVKMMADLLGHSSISITGDIYGHSTDEGARAAVVRGVDGGVGIANGYPNGFPPPRGYPSDWLYKPLNCINSGRADRI